MYNCPESLCLKFFHLTVIYTLQRRRDIEVTFFTRADLSQSYMSVHVNEQAIIQNDRNTGRRVLALHGNQKKSLQSML